MLKLVSFGAAMHRSGGGCALLHGVLHGIEIFGAYKRLVLCRFETIFCELEFALLQFAVARHAALFVSL